MAQYYDAIAYLLHVIFANRNICLFFGWTKITKGFQFMNKRKHNGSTLYENELFQFIFIKFYFENIHNWGAYPFARNWSSFACHWGGIQVTLWIRFWDYFSFVNFIKFQFKFQGIVQFHTFVPNGARNLKLLSLMLNCVWTLFYFNFARLSRSIFNVQTNDLHSKHIFNNTVLI